MSKTPGNTIRLPFSDKYDHMHSQAYFHKHKEGLARRLSSWRDMQLARKALHKAGDPTLVLDLPCGAGRFWPVLVEHQNRMIIAADNSANMLEVAQAEQSHLLNRLRLIQTSAFDINLPDASVDSIFCMRLLHHIGDAEHRLAMLKEFHRVTRETVILSLWVDGNYKAWKRKRLDMDRSRNEKRHYQNRFVLPAGLVEKEFAEAGFAVTDYLDFLPCYSMWRTYILRKK